MVLKFAIYNCFIKLKINKFWYEFNGISMDKIRETLYDKSLSYSLCYTKIKQYDIFIRLVLFYDKPI